MSNRKREILFWLFKALSVIVACTLPVLAIFEKFPMWRDAVGEGRSIGAGLILTLIVLAIIFRKAVFDFCRDKLKLQHAPPITIWIGCLIASYILMYLDTFLADLNIVFWMGLIGCAIGNILTFIANRFVAKEKSNE